MGRGIPIERSEINCKHYSDCKDYNKKCTQCKYNTFIPKIEVSYYEPKLPQMKPPVFRNYI